MKFRSRRRGIAGPCRSDGATIGFLRTPSIRPRVFLIMRQILFIQGGGAEVHDAWDDKLVASLKRELGEGHEVRYPRMPDDDDPSFANGRRHPARGC